jgi:hypothetical protein
MAKKESRIHCKRVVIAAGKRGRRIAIGLLLSLIIASSVFTAWGKFFAAQKPRTSNKPAPPASPALLNLSPTSPAKEYIYAGGRLLATEERGPANNFDGDGKADVAVWRPSTGVWYILKSSDGSTVTQTLGVSTDVIVPADYDGDGKMDVAVWRPSTGVWYILKSSDGMLQTVNWGVQGDFAVPADYDGDGKADVAVYRPSTLTWYIINSSTGSSISQAWGVTGDLPEPADYDGDGKADVAIWRPSSGQWWILNSSNGAVQNPGWGVNGDQPVEAAYVR